MKDNERFLNTLMGKEVDRMPVIENSIWWDKTISRWNKEGLNLCPDYSYRWQEQIQLEKYFGLDLVGQFWVKPYTAATPWRGYGKGMVDTMEEYEKNLLPNIYPEPSIDPEFVKEMKTLQSKGKVTLELIVNGAFWEPREYLGIEGHMLSFYDNEELYERMVRDLIAWEKRVVEVISNQIQFDFVTIAEDMSYNKGSMIGADTFEKFIAPYYKAMVPTFKDAGLFVMVDSDGNIDEPISWWNQLGVQGYHPLEKKADMDVNYLQKKYPETAFLGNYDKMVMKFGEKEMEQEFERLAPAIRKGRYIVSVDHQTPPEVSLENYRIYNRLQKKFAQL